MQVLGLRSIRIFVLISHLEIKLKQDAVNPFDKLNVRIQNLKQLHANLARLIARTPVWIYNFSQTIKDLYPVGCSVMLWTHLSVTMSVSVKLYWKLSCFEVFLWCIGDVKAIISLTKTLLNLFVNKVYQKLSTDFNT